MNCRRCAGALVRDWITDILDETGQIQCDGWRCINCGNVQDPVILYHQMSGLPARTPARERARRRMARLKIAV